MLSVLITIQMQTGHLIRRVTFRIVLYKHHQVTERAGGGTDFFTHKSGTRNWLIYYFQLDTQIPCSLTQITLTLRRLMSYIYGAPILDVSRSHTMTQHSR